MLRRALAGAVRFAPRPSLIPSLSSLLLSASAALFSSNLPLVTETVSAGTLAEAQALINDPDQRLDLVFTDIELGEHKEAGITIGMLIDQARPRRSTRVNHCTAALVQVVPMLLRKGPLRHGQ